MANVTVGGPPNYTPNNGNIKVKHDGTLKVNPPSQGCTVCLSQTVNGQSSYSSSNSTDFDIDFSNIAEGTVIKFCTCAYNSTCDPNAPGIKDDGGHTITIDSSGK